MVDLSKQGIEELFYRQMKKKTMQCIEQSFDFQFSGDWVRGDANVF